MSVFSAQMSDQSAQMSCTDIYLINHVSTDYWTEAMIDDIYTATRKVGRHQTPLIEKWQTICIHENAECLCKTTTFQYSKYVLIKISSILITPELFVRIRTRHTKYGFIRNILENKEEKLTILWRHYIIYVLQNIAYVVHWFKWVC
jgi:hypothetical protein